MAIVCVRFGCQSAEHGLGTYDRVSAKWNMIGEFDASACAMTRTFDSCRLIRFACECECTVEWVLCGKSFWRKCRHILDSLDRWEVLCSTLNQLNCCLPLVRHPHGKHVDISNMIMRLILVESWSCAFNVPNHVGWTKGIKLFFSFNGFHYLWQRVCSIHGAAIHLESSFRDLISMNDIRSVFS